jgi:glutamate racemase
LSAIGIFDSGMGGLTVMRALKARLPNESFVYLGDTARLPYGTKSADTVTRYAVQASAALMAYDIKLLVVACNTASAAALPTLIQNLSPLPVVGVIEPGAQAAVRAAPEGPIAVIATEGTVKGGAYVSAIQALEQIPADVGHRLYPAWRK